MDGFGQGPDVDVPDCVASSLAPTESVSDLSYGRTGGVFRPVGVPSRRKLLIVDSNAMERECIEYYLSRNARDFVLECVSDIHQTPSSVPNLILLVAHHQIQENRLYDLITEVRARFGELPVVLVSDLDTRIAARAIRHGLRGFIPASLPTTIVIEVLRLVLSGGTYVPMEIMEREAACNQIVKEEKKNVSNGQDSTGFTDREAEILDKLRQGKTNKTIAAELTIAESTVKVHVRSIMRKLNATNRTQAAFLARERHAGQPSLPDVPKLLRAT